MRQHLPTPTGINLTLGLWLLSMCLLPSLAMANSSLDQQGKTTPLRLRYLDALSLFDGKHQRLILSPHLELPEHTTRVCWVIPTPALVEHATALEPGAFHDLERRIRTGRLEQVKAKPSKPLPSKPLLKAQLSAPDMPPLSGSTELEIIKATGQDALSPLNAWLISRKCAPLEPEQIAYYIERQWHFVAVSTFAKPPATLTGTRHEPIALTFASEHAILPLKAPWSSSPFPTRYHLLTHTPQGLESLSSPISRGFEISSILGYPGHSPGAKVARYTTEPDRLKLEQLPSSWRSLSRSPWKADQSVQLRVLWLPNNEGKANPKTWIEELAIPTPPETMRLEGAPSPPPPIAPTPKDAPPKEHIKFKTTTTSSPTPKPAPSSCATGAAPAPKGAAPMIFIGVLLVSLRSKTRRIKTRRP